MPLPQMLLEDRDAVRQVTVMIRKDDVAFKQSIDSNGLSTATGDKVVDNPRINTPKP